jgi:hypothetical protein
MDGEEGVDIVDLWPGRRRDLTDSGVGWVGLGGASLRLTRKRGWRVPNQFRERSHVGEHERSLLLKADFATLDASTTMYLGLSILALPKTLRRSVHTLKAEKGGGEHLPS